jgi:hypothetical protein
MESIMSYISWRGKILLCITASILSSCDFVVEKHLYKGVPYTDERTAGTGIMYVLAKKMPARGVNTETIMHQDALDINADTVSESLPQDPEFLQELLQHKTDQEVELEEEIIAPIDPVVNKILRK